MKLRKWQSNSKELLETVPKDLRKKDWLQILSYKYHVAKTLGIIWNIDYSACSERIIWLRTTSPDCACVYHYLQHLLFKTK